MSTEESSNQETPTGKSNDDDTYELESFSETASEDPPQTTNDTHKEPPDKNEKFDEEPGISFQGDDDESGVKFKTQKSGPRFQTDDEESGIKIQPNAIMFGEATEPKRHSPPPSSAANSKRKSSMKKSNGPKRNNPANRKKGSVSFASPGDDGPSHEKKRASVGFAVEAVPSRDKAGLNAPNRKSQQKEAVPNIPSGSRPDWYEDLGDVQINMFKEVFELLDKDGGGSIDADELFLCLKELDIDISLEEIKNVLSELDSDGNGEIDFDEFLYAMASTDRYLSMCGDGQGETSGAEGEEKYNRRQTLFFTAITRFAIKNSLGDIERYYANKMRQAPHVISSYTAGARLIGLSDRQLEQELRRMQKAAKNQDSPYAKPLPFVHFRKKTKKKPTSAKKAMCQPILEEEKGPKKSASTELINHDDEMVLIQSRARARGKQNVYTDSDQEIMKALQSLANSGNVIAKLPGVHIIPQIRSNLKKNKKGDANALCSSMRKKRKSQSSRRGIKPPYTTPTDHKHKLDRPKVRKPHGWQIPCIERGQAPLPVVMVPSRKSHRYTIDDLSGIRKKVSESVDVYYDELKHSMVKTAWEHWNELHTEEIPSYLLRENFRKVYEAYSPHTTKDIFAISPWVPGPRAGPTAPVMSYISHTKATHTAMLPTNMAKSSASAPVYSYSRPPSRCESTPPVRVTTPVHCQRCFVSPTP